MRDRGRRSGCVWHHALDGARCVGFPRSSMRARPAARDGRPVARAVRDSCAGDGVRDDAFAAARRAAQAGRAALPVGPAGRTYEAQDAFQATFLVLALAKGEIALHVQDSRW